MLFGTLTGKVNKNGSIVVATNKEGVTTEIRLIAFGKGQEKVTELAGSNASVEGILVRDKDTRDLVIEVQNIVAAPKAYTPNSFTFSAVITPTEAKESVNEKTTLTLSSYSTNPGRDAGLTGVNIKYYNPTDKMNAMLSNIAVKGNKTQLFVIGNLDIYVGEGSEGGTYTILSIWSRQFEILRAPKGGQAAAKSAPVTSTLSEDDDF